MLCSFVIAACAAEPPAPTAPVDTPAPPSLPTATEVFQRTASAYANANSYADEGEQVTQFFAGKRSHTKRLTFTTAFVRPDKFRFEYRDDGKPDRAFVVWSNGSSTKTQWFVQGNTVKDLPELGLAIAGATGVSGGTAHSVPNLLMPDVVEGRSTLAIRNAHVDGTDWVDARPCYKVSGTLLDDSHATTLWIDAETYMLRKVFVRSHLTPPNGEPFDAESMTHYVPVLNGSVSDAALAEPVEH